MRPQDSELTGALEHPIGEVASLFPLTRVREDLLFDEIADGLPELLVLFGEWLPHGNVFLARSERPENTPVFPIEKFRVRNISTEHDGGKGQIERAALTFGLPQKGQGVLGGPRREVGGAVRPACQSSSS